MGDGEMQQKYVIKTRFSQFSDKRFYFLDGITSLLLPHPYLNEFDKYKKQKDQKYFWQEEDKLLVMENKVQLMNERLSVYRQILNSLVQFFPLSKKINFASKFRNILKYTRDFVLKSLWM